MKKIIKSIANERIEILFNLSKKYVKLNEDLSKYYIDLIKKLRKKYHPKIKKEIKYFLCKRCNLPLIPGYNANIRIKKYKTGKVKIIIRCKRCNNIKRIIRDKNGQCISSQTNDMDR